MTFHWLSKGLEESVVCNEWVSVVRDFTGERDSFLDEERLVARNDSRGHPSLSLPVSYCRDLL